MKRAKYLIIAVIVVLLLAISIGPAAAQSNSPVTAEVDRTSLTTDDILTLVVTVDSAIGDASQPLLPALDGFQVLGSSRGSQMTIVNGHMSSHTYYQFSLQPSQPGDWLIGPVSVTAGGATHETAPITVRVSQGTGVPSQPAQPNSTFPSLPGLGSLGSLGNLGSLSSLGSLGTLLSPPAAPAVPVVPVEPSPPPAELQGQDLYLEAVVDNPTPYQGQQILYHVRLYQAVQGLGPLDYRPPSFTGFWSEQLSEQGEYMTQAAGRNYRVTQLTSVLFPTVVGEAVIDPATIAVPGDFFTRGANLASQPVKVNVQPLPDNAPPGFQGAVGRFDIQATVDKAETRVDDTVNWQVVLSGQGNVENLPDPVWNEGPAWRAFDSEASVDHQFENGLMAGNRIYDRVLVPTEAGRLTLPAVQYSYFDPELGEYLTIESQPLSVEVMPDDSNPANAPTLPASAADALASPVSGIAGHLQPLKEAPARWSTGSPWLTDKIAFWLLWLIPLGLLAGHYGWQRRQNRRLSNVSTLRSKQAAGKALDALHRARKEGGDECHQACGRILTTFVSEKLDRSLTGMTQDAVDRTLFDRGVDSELVSRVERCLMLSDMGRYAPSDLYQAGDDLLGETESLIADLDEVL